VLARDRLVVALRARGIADERVLSAMATVPRHEFVPDTLEPHAYDDMPLAIGWGQTISQPFVVAIMVEKLALRGDERVLEVGTGSGYAAAVCGSLAARVDTIERIDELADLAEARLMRLGYDHVHVHRGDGSLGLPGFGPFDAIVVAAGAPDAPPSLLAQLAAGGRLVMPLGSVHDQHLVRITPAEHGTYSQRDFGDVRFVPLIGAEAWPERSVH
jgi:protein-L-isoaspartate(D-aspartate) O-methyltransferase